MTHIQLLRAGFPDPRFYGNTFVAVNLASNIPGGVIVSNKPSDSQETWRNILAKREHPIGLEYDEYMDQSSNLTDIIKKHVDRSTKPVVVHYHFMQSELSAGVPQRVQEEFGGAVKQIAHLHCSADFYFKSPGTNPHKLRTRQLREAVDAETFAHYVAVSHAVEDGFREHVPADRLVTVRNGIDEHTYNFRPERDKEAFKNQFDVNGKLIIGYAGRLDKVKGYTNLIKVLHWFDQRPEHDVGFLIATGGGGGKLRLLDKHVRERAPRIGAEGRIGVITDIAKYIGEVKLRNQEASEIFRDFAEENVGQNTAFYKGVSPAPAQALMDIYIQPSESEGLPLSIIEALFVGTPVVANRVGGIQEIVSDTTGRVIGTPYTEPRWTEDFCEGIIDVADHTYGPGLEEDTTEYRSQLRTRLVPQFGAKAMTAKMQELYDE